MMRELIKRLEHELDVSIHTKCTGIIFEFRNEEIEKIIGALKNADTHTTQKN